MNKRILAIGIVAAIGLLFLSSLIWSVSEATAVSATATANSQTATSPIYPDQRHSATAAVNWLVATHQNDDGGYSSFSSGANQAPSDVGGTLDAIIAIAATGHNPAATYPGKSSNPVTYLHNSADDLATFAATGGASNGKAILALTAVNQDPRNFMGYNFVISLTTQLSPTGQYNAQTPFEQSLALLGLAAAHQTAPPEASQWLTEQQAANGSWDDGFGTADNADATALAIMALIAQGEPITGTTLTAAQDFLANSQLSDGGWAYAPEFGGNANSTGLVLQALSALGQDFYRSNGPWSQNGHTPLIALLTYQSSSGGFQSDFGFGPFDDFFTTVQVLPAVTGKAFPLPARYEAARQAIACLATLQDADSGGWEQFAGFGVDAAGTARALKAITAFGDDPQSPAWTPNTVNAVEALENLTPAYLAEGRGGRVGIILQGVVAAGDPYTVTNFAGYNLPLSATNYLSPTGEYDSTAFGPLAHNQALLGLIMADEQPDPSAISWLQGAASNGSWGETDANGTSLQVLGRLGETIPFAAFVHLRTTQQLDGGWGFDGVANPSSTAEAVQGIGQNGDNPFAPAWSMIVSGTIQSPADVIMQQQGDNGCWPNLFGSGDDPFSTTDAILLLMVNPEWPTWAAYYEYLRQNYSEVRKMVSLRAFDNFLIHGIKNYVRKIQTGFLIPAKEKQAKLHP